MTDIICRSCKNDEFIQTPVVKLQFQSEEDSTVVFENLNVSLVKQAYLCARCHAALREGIYKKNRIIISIVDRLIQKTIKVSDLYKEMKDTVRILVKNRKEYLQLRSEIDSIGTRCSVINNELEVSEKNVVVMGLSRDYEFDSQKNYFLVVSRKEVDDKGLTETVLNDIFSEKFDVVFA